MLICFHKFKFLVAIFPCSRFAFGDSIILVFVFFSLVMK